MLELRLRRPAIGELSWKVVELFFPSGWGKDGQLVFIGILNKVASCMRHTVLGNMHVRNEGVESEGD